jgi:hypothetical protein
MKPSHSVHCGIQHVGLSIDYPAAINNVLRIYTQQLDSFRVVTHVAAAVNHIYSSLFLVLIRLSYHAL